MTETLQCLKRHGQRLDLEIAKEMRVPHVTVRQHLTAQAERREAIICKTNQSEKGRPFEAWQGVVHIPADPGRIVDEPKAAVKRTRHPAGPPARGDRRLASRVRDGLIASTEVRLERIDDLGPQPEVARQQVTDVAMTRSFVGLSVV